MWREVLIVVFSSFWVGLPEPIPEEKTARVSYNGYKLLRTDLALDILQNLEKEYGKEIPTFQLKSICE